MSKSAIILFVILAGCALPLHAQKEIQGYWQNKNREAEIDKNTKQTIIRNVIIDSPVVSISYSTFKNAKFFQHKDTTIKYKPQIPVLRTVNTKAYFAKYGINLKAAGLTAATTKVYINYCTCPGIEDLAMIDDNTIVVFFGKTYTVLTRSKSWNE